MSNWISTENGTKMPGEGDYLTMYDGNMRVPSVCKDTPGYEEDYTAFDYWWDINADEEVDHMSVTHWQPLPEPPKDGE